jgi:hypothetical protein
MIRKQARTPTAPSTRWRDVLKIHPAADLFPLLDPEELRALGDDIRKHGLREPVVVMRQYRRRQGGTMDVREYDLVLIDGRNRLDAMEAVGFTLVRDGKLDPTLGHKVLGLEPLTGAYAELDDDVDVYAFVISRNIRRRHLTTKQKRDLIAKLIKAEPENSDRQIAGTVKASPTTVGTVRAEMEAAGDVSKLDTRRDTKGRKQPARKPPAKKRPGKATKVPRPRDGPDSTGEAERLRARSKELENIKRRLKPPDDAAALYCSFCPKSQHEVETLIISHGQLPACICNECVAECVKIIDERKAATGGAPAADDGLDIPAFLIRSTAP